MHCPSSIAAPAEPGQASGAALPEQQVTAAASKPAVSAAAPQDLEADMAPEAEEWRPFRPHEQKVAAALLVVLKKALRRGGMDDMTGTKYLLIANNPVLSHFLGRVPDGELPSLKQLEAQATSQARGVLALLYEHCAAAGWQPLEVFTRSAQCSTHLIALQDKHAGDGADGAEFCARLQRLQAVEVFFAVDSKNAGFVSKGKILYHHGIARATLGLIMTVLDEVMVLSVADRQQRGAKTMAGAHTSFIACIDHMLPGEDAAAVHMIFVLR